MSRISAPSSPPDMALSWTQGVTMRPSVEGFDRTYDSYLVEKNVNICSVQRPLKVAAMGEAGGILACPASRGVSFLATGKVARGGWRESLVVLLSYELQHV